MTTERQIRTLNGKLLAWTIAVIAASAVVVHCVHGLQVRRGARVWLQTAVGAQEAGDLERALTFYVHYLAYEPDDVAALARYGLAMDERARTIDDWVRVQDVLDRVLRRDPERRDVRFRLVLNDIRLRRFADAIANIKLLLPRADNKAELEHMLGWCLEATGDYKGAAAAFKRATELDPSRLDSYALLAEVLQVRLGQTEEAEAVFDALVKANSKSFRAYLIRCRFRQQQNLPDLAEADLRQALDLAPSEPAVLLAAADWALARGELDRARQWLQKAREVEPANAAVFNALVWLAMRAGRTAEAHRLLEEAEKATGDNAELRLAQCRVLRAEGTSAARRRLAALSVGLERFTTEERARVLRALAEAWTQLGEPDRAEALWQRLIRELPDDLEGRFALLDRALQRGDLGKAKGLLAELRKLEGDAGKYWPLGQAALLIEESYGEPFKRLAAREQLDALARPYPAWAPVSLLQARLEDLDGNYDRASGHFLRAVTLGPVPPRQFSRLIELLVLFKRYVEAEEVLSRVAEQGPLPPALERRRAEIALANHNIEEALRLAQTTVGQGSRDYRDYLWLARIYHGVGQEAEAEEALRQATSLAPETPDAWVALVEQLARTGQRQAAQQAATEAALQVTPPLVKDTRARCFEAMGLTAPADALYERALGEPTGVDFVFLVHAADFYRHNDEPEKARPFLERLLLIDDAVPPQVVSAARRQLALILAAQQDYSGASALLGANATTRPNDAADQRAHAVVMAAQTGQRRPTIRVFEETAKHQPLTLEEQLILAGLLDADGDEARARDLIVALLTAEPDNPQFLAAYIRLLTRGDEKDEARVQLDKLLRLEPDSRRTRELAEVLRQKN
jgi:tetratricopeptide (TPR) repeat protein